MATTKAVAVQILKFRHVFPFVANSTRGTVLPKDPHGLLNGISHRFVQRSVS